MHRRRRMAIGQAWPGAIDTGNGNWQLGNSCHLSERPALSAAGRPTIDTGLASDGPFQFGAGASQGRRRRGGAIRSSEASGRTRARVGSGLLFSANRHLRALVSGQQRCRGLGQAEVLSGCLHPHVAVACFNSIGPARIPTVVCCVFACRQSRGGCESPETDGCCRWPSASRRGRFSAAFALAKNLCQKCQNAGIPKSQGSVLASGLAAFFCRNPFSPPCRY